MANSMSRVLVHFVWGTWRRTPWIDERVETTVRDVVAAQAERLHSPMRAFGAFDDHVHVLLDMHRTRSMKELARAMKSASSHEVIRLQSGEFAWQEGYGAFSVSERDPGHVVAYIAEQRQRHLRGEIDSAWEPVWDEDSINE